MKPCLPGLLMFALFAFCINPELQAQKTSGKTTFDSTLNILRKEKIPCPPQNGTAEKPTLPLPSYYFTSSLSASFSFVDSTGNTTSNTDYTYYFDNSSCCFAIKESYHWKNQHHVTFRIEEIKDSVGFRANLNDSSRNLECKILKNCHRHITYKSTHSSQAALYRKTGKTQLIQGILCEELIFENDQVATTIWVTSKEDPWINKIRTDLQCSLYNELTVYTNGIVLASESYFKQTKHKQKFAVTELNKNTSNRITTKGSKLVSGF